MRYYPRLIWVKRLDFGPICNNIEWIHSRFSVCRHKGRKCMLAADQQTFFIRLPFQKERPNYDQTGRDYTVSSEYPVIVMRLKDFPTHSYFCLPVGD